MELTLKTQYDGRFIKQTWEIPGTDPRFPDRVFNVHQRMVDTEDAGVRQALINMGWTPPCRESSTTGAGLNESVSTTVKEKK
jgi:hypothetical protein